MGRSGYLAAWNGMEMSQHVPHMTGTVVCLWHSPTRWLKPAQLVETSSELRAVPPTVQPSVCSAELAGTRRNRNSITLNIAPVSSFAFLTSTRNTLEEKGMFQDKTIFQFFIWQEKRKNVTFGSDGTEFFSPWEKSLKSQDLAQLLKLEPL